MKSVCVFEEIVIDNDAEQSPKSVQKDDENTIKEGECLREKVRRKRTVLVAPR